MLTPILEGRMLQALAVRSTDAVLEVGIANYRIFEGQTSLQVLLKLIDPVSRQVIARTVSKTCKAVVAFPRCTDPAMQRSLR